VAEYVIKGIDAAKPSKLKLNYSPKTGIFMGSFTLCATKEGVRPKTRKYTVQVVGFVVDGEGVGFATLKKPATSWPVTLELE
jgi:hypothetical protein